ncbi:MAG: TRAP transporter large permease subunit [Ignavibacteriaceae bacterium]|nr:TRAP transporter large permease subunit [Ignavibacteriaceae bacterium]
MTDALPLLFFAVVIIFLLSGFPVAFTLGGVSVVFGLIVFGFDFFYLLPLRIWGTMTNYVLISVPMFIFMGLMFEKSGIAEELLETLALIFGKLRGGLAFAVLFVGAILGASTGIVGATVVTLGVLGLPVMIKRNCDVQASAGIIAASGTLGQIIPPSVILILLGSVLNLPIGDLFIAATGPGLFLVLLYFLYILSVTLLRPKIFPAMPAEALAEFSHAGKIKRIITSLFLPGLLVMAVLGSIFMGIASPTEAAAVGAMGATLLTLFKGRLTFQNLKYVSTKTVSVTSMVFLILIGASAFALVFRGLNGDRYLTELIMASELGPHIFLLLMMLLIFVAGFFIDFIEIVFILVPVIAPIALHYGFDMKYIAILIALNLQTSFLTPPFGFSLFYLKGVAPLGVSTMQIYKGAVPYVIMQLVCLLAVAVFPEISTWLLKILK